MFAQFARIVIGAPVEELSGVTAIASQTSRVRKQLRDRHARDRRMQTIDVVAGRIVELELPLLTQLHDARGGEALGMRRDAEAVSRGERFAAVEIGMTEGVFEHDLVTTRDRDDAAWLLRGLHLEFEPARDVVER